MVVLGPPAGRQVLHARPDKPVIFWTPDHGAFVVRPEP